MKAEFAEQHPDIVNSLDKLAGKISKVEMIEINYRESRRRKTDGRSTGLFKEKRLGNRAGNNIWGRLKARFNKMKTGFQTTFLSSLPLRLYCRKYFQFRQFFMPDFLPVPATELWQATLEHLRLSLIALLCAVALAVPLAVWLADKRRWAEGVLQVTNILQTIPSLALLGLLIPFVGIGSPPVLIALTLYALLPIFQNTYLGLSQIDPAIKEAHTAFGLSRWQALWRIELPMALPAMISGIRTASVLIIGTATLAALIGAGGLGNLILLGIDRNNMAMTFTGALLSALLAVLVSGGIGILQKSKHKLPITAALLAILIAIGLACSTH